MKKIVNFYDEDFARRNGYLMDLEDSKDDDRFICLTIRDINTRDMKIKLVINKDDLKSALDFFK